MNEIQVKRGVELKIRDLREGAGMTQGELAAELGVDRSSITKWETGEAMPRASLLPKIARVLSCSIGALYGDVAEESEVHNEEV